MTNVRLADGQQSEFVANDSPQHWDPDLPPHPKHHEEPEGLERAKPIHTQCQASQRVELQCLGHATKVSAPLAANHRAHR